MAIQWLPLSTRPRRLFVEELWILLRESLQEGITAEENHPIVQEQLCKYSPNDYSALWVC